MSDSFPDILYKYRYFDKDDYHLRILTHNEIFFASHICFNDPFDCSIPPRYDVGTREQLLPKIMAIVKQNEKGLRKVEARRRAKELFKTGKHKDRNRQQEISDEFNNENFGIFSLSSKKDSLLCWAHYSDSHNGFCVGFDVRVFDKMIKKALLEDDKLLVIQKVIYDDKMPVIIPFENDFPKRILAGLTTKSKAWEYEDEYRMILQEGANKPIEIPKEAIKEVYIGCQMQKENKEKLISIVRAQNTKTTIYEAKKSLDEFKLLFEVIK